MRQGQQKTAFNCVYFNVMKTSLYNHKGIETDGKPLIPNIVFKSLLHLIMVKDFEAADYIIKNYSFVPDQVSLYRYYTKEKCKA